MKRGRRKGGSKDKVFGCDLVEHLTATSQDIPHVLRSCSIFIEEHGIVDGIYRLSGVSSNTQKLRSEFDSEGTPDLNKDVYLQDIHCVSSLCKAYFRELPNPLLTYQLYDHFAEAVAVQLEDERLVKIKEVLKELPEPHFRTLEYLMKHLIRMATHSNQTNMHARNLAIVWAPNLLRSKDIEAAGFNGTAAFMEVRVQSIVVEFILTHVSQLFPESDLDPGLTRERRKSLPSPSILSGQEDPFFKALPFQYPGNMSPGDGPPPMRPYHAIIDGTDKRKGSLKGRKWKSIFNLGGRLHDPRKKKYAPKEKEKTSLRPAKSMDSLSSGPYTQEDPRHASPHLSPLAVPSGTTEGGAAGGGSVASGYAVTYRRTGGASVSMVSGGSGAQGTYRSLDSGLGANADKTQCPSQVMPSRAERRAGMHISGPFSVTVPLHITSGLALGVLHGGRAEEEEPRHEPDEEGPPKKDKHESAEEKETELDQEKVETDRKTESVNDDKENKTDNVSGGDEEKEVKREDSEPVETRSEEREEPEDEGAQGQNLSAEEVSNEIQHATDRPSLSEDMDGGDYMVMKGRVLQCSEGDDQNESLSIPCQEESYPDHELPLDFQDTFGFLDLMDMSASNQLNEFSVEPPPFEMEIYEEEDDQSPSQIHPPPELSYMKLPAHTGRAMSNKSCSLPYKCSSFQPDLSFSSDEDCYSGPSDDDDDSSDLDKDEYEDMFYKSLPSDSHFHGLSWTEPQIIMLDSDSNIDSHSTNQSECLNQTKTVSEDTQDSCNESQSNDLEMITTNAVDQSLNEGDLSPLPLETEHLNVEKKNSEDGGTENDGEDKSGLEELGDVNEPTQADNEMMESTDSKDETFICSLTDSHSTDDDTQEDTYFGPDPPSTPEEPSNNETAEISCTTDPVITEEPASSEAQQESTAGYVGITESKIIIDVTSPELQKTQNKTETDNSSMKAEIILEEQTDENEGVVLSEERDVGEKGNDERDISEEKGESMESEPSEEGKNDVDPTNQIDVDEMGKESKKREQIHLENKSEDVDVEKQKEDSDVGDENDQQVEQHGAEEETEAQKDNHLEGVAELKEGSVPEELSEEDDRLSEDAEEQQSGKENDMTKEENHEDPSTSDRQKPPRPPRIKDRDRGRDAGLGLGVGRKIIISKHKMYQVRAVPVVPPKPQHSKITAFRQQFQKRDTERQQKPIQRTCPERQRTERGLPKKETENEENSHAEIGDVAQNHDCHNTEQDKEMGTDGERLEENNASQAKKQLKDTKSCDGSEGEIEQGKEEQRQRSGTWDGGSLRKDGHKEVDKEAKRTNAISMCFDEAVARATGKRYKERECIEKDRFVDLQLEKDEQKEGLNERKNEEEEVKTD
ncbi:rho GTPase-activating protein 30 [Clarias gariepinus]|uniref:rho GTPase-activating protein 30 n=1 Tax=Clarias gariepinus TaxID=13013 RepID=UPI00234C6BE7|nr:rho GTPase-activating protein 30 [Clarias gariepinus]